MSLFGTVTCVLMACVDSSGQAQLIGADWEGGVGLTPESFYIKRKPINGNT